jgi:tRNA pseudouridine55 synthase
MYSALHHNGQRLHELARAGVEVERKARGVNISRLQLMPEAEALQACSVLADTEPHIRPCVGVAETRTC